jgi:hypothetical protein
MRRTFALTLALIAASPCAVARADDEATCGGEPFRFILSDVKGRLFDGAESVTKVPVTLFFYQGYKSANVMENLRQALKHDAVVGDDTKLGERWAGFPIIDYKEGWFVPGWAIDKVLRDKMAKYPKTIFLTDKGECLSKSGTSNKCPAGTRIPYFKSNQGSVAVVYRGALVKKFAGHTEPGPFVELIRKLTAQAEKGASYCEMKKALAGAD